MSSLLQFLRSTVFTKIVMAITGLLIIGFLIGHMLGNLLMFAGPEKINAYALGLKNLGPLLWLVRFAMIAAFGLHIWSSIELASRNKLARPVQYDTKKSLKSTFASRTMLVSGLAILFFVIYHLLHYTFGIIQPNTYYAGGYRMESTGEIVHNVYNMVVAGFQNPFIALSYIIALIFMSSHVSHATSSAFQTLGVMNPNIKKITSKIGPALAGLFLVGYLSIPIGVMIGVIKKAPDQKHVSTMTKDCPDTADCKCE
ncbi:MAG: succinate dehydrogenase cytochrome b subunit [Ignavibacteria bacterium]|jgi:succinate dehydrogenase / fumarate reductase cytochrome b subunit